MINAFYQLVFLGNTSHEACRNIREKFFERLKERDLPDSIISVLDATNFSKYTSCAPTFVFYFGSVGHEYQDVDHIQELKDNADSIYPIFFTEGAFYDEVPEILHPINGILYKAENINSIVNVAFEELRLLRKKRRVFISYKRSDSAAVANQLYDVLSRYQFDVFLDTYSIRGSADFQAELHHRITDSDVLIQLNSPNFKDSKWCEEEISEANARQVGVLQINWPNVRSGATEQLSSVLHLSSMDFRRKRYKSKASTLKSKVVSRIANNVEGIRARNIAARHDNLTAEFVKEAAKQGRTIIKEPLFLIEQRDNDKFWCYIPAIGVPQSMDCFESVKMLEHWGDSLPERVFLIYDDLRILPHWIEHLDWMNKYLEVKTIKKQKFDQWLKETI